MQVLPRDSDVDLVPLVKAKSCHYVGLALPGLTFPSCVVLFGAGFDVASRNDFMLAVNRAKETGTFYPAANVTLLPVPSASYSGLDRTIHHDDAYTYEEVLTHLRDAVLANREYVKSDTVYFDFRDIDRDPSAEIYRRALTAVLPELEGIDVITWA